jgi:hypothetical protein
VVKFVAGTSSFGTTVFVCLLVNMTCYRIAHVRASIT